MLITEGEGEGYPGMWMKDLNKQALLSTVNTIEETGHCETVLLLFAIGFYK